MPNMAVSTIAGDREAAERPGAEVADDRGVGEQVERFGDQCAEGGEREPDDLAVVRAPPAPCRPLRPPSAHSCR